MYKKNFLRKLYKKIFKRDYVTCQEKKVIRNFIHEGNLLKMNLSENAFIEYRSEVMSFFSRLYENIEEWNLSNQYFAKIGDAIGLDGNMIIRENDKHTFRKVQLDAILADLNAYQRESEIFWSNIRSWLSIFIAFAAFIVSVFL